MVRTISVAERALEVDGSDRSVAPEHHLFNLIKEDAGCGVRCLALLDRWGASFQSYAERHPGHSVILRSESAPGLEGGVSEYEQALAMLPVPARLEDYLAAIGDKSRNIIRKAERAGFEYRDADCREWLDDIFAIRTSDPLRQGRAIPEYYLKYPAPPIRYGGYCGNHGEVFAGVFQGERLCAYATLSVTGEIAQIQQILGHRDVLKDGVMYLLMREIVRILIERWPAVRAVNYLYPDKPSSGLGRFKRGVGFRPLQSAVVRAPADAVPPAERLPMKEGGEPSPEFPSEEKKPQKKVFDLDETFLFDGDVLPPIEWRGLSPLKCVLRMNDVDRCLYLFDNHGVAGGEVCGSQIVVTVQSAETFWGGGADLELSAVVGDFRPGMMLEALSKRLSSIGRALKPGGLFVVKFTYDTLAAASSFPELAPEIESIAERFAKRFRGQTRMSTPDLSTMFRGTDFQVRGMIDCAPSEAAPSGLAWLVLKKVRV